MFQLEALDFLGDGDGGTPSLFICNEINKAMQCFYLGLLICLVLANSFSLFTTFWPF